MLNLRKRLHLVLLNIGRDYDDRTRGHVQRYIITSERHKTASLTVMEGQSIVLLAFLLLVVLGTVMTAPNMRTLAQEVVPTIGAPRSR